ncbi:MAG: hydrolase [Rhodobacteraceae bacterium]|nr:hydrolase [Paracoccaceae bacterium]MAY47454.1 hydrolase [Paracoccaceae bacterium]
MKTVLCFGDSNTYGTLPMPSLDHDERYGMDTRWPRVMAAGLGEGWHLVEEGHPGRTTVHDDPIEGIHRNGARILLAILDSHRPVDVLVLMLGTNDHKQRFGLGPQDIAMGAGRLVAMAQASGRVDKILLVCPPKCLERGVLAQIFAGAEARGKGLADEMKREAAAKGVAFFDAGTVIESDPVDGVHFSAEAHVALGQAMVEQVLAL